MSKEKIGIFGGTFSPPHVGHVASAEAFSRAVDFDKILIIPDFLPPHKEIDGEASAEQRLKMCNLAFSHIKSSVISDMEIKRGGRSYTYQTLQELSSVDRELYFLMGPDMFLTLLEWKNPQRIFELATICLVRRETDSGELIKAKVIEYQSNYGANILIIDTDIIEVSSSEIRETLHRGCDSENVPRQVMDYIKEAGIYR